MTSWTAAIIHSIITIIAGLCSRRYSSLQLITLLTHRAIIHTSGREERSNRFGCFLFFVVIYIYYVYSTMFIFLYIFFCFYLYKVVDIVNSSHTHCNYRNPRVGLMTTKHYNIVIRSLSFNVPMPPRKRAYARIICINI